MSAISLSQQSSLQDQKERENLRTQYSARAPVDEPLAAPMPTRAAAAMPPTAAVWSPEMGIKFGGPAPASAAPNMHNPAYPQAKPGRWSPSKGVNFG
jgi:programmed cell death 6-interacting protein